MTRYYIIYPGGDRTKIGLLEYSEFDYDLSDYVRASREEFTVRETALEYAKNLARNHGKTFVADNPEDEYLD